jgi:hypothetical protein
VGTGLDPDLQVLGPVFGAPAVGGADPEHLQHFKISNLTVGAISMKQIYRFEKCIKKCIIYINIL